jgi:hypothetical protein
MPRMQEMLLVGAFVRRRAAPVLDAFFPSPFLHSYLYKTGTCERSQLAGSTSHSGWVNPPLINFGSSIITAGADFLFCPL